MHSCARGVTIDRSLPLLADALYLVKLFGVEVAGDKVLKLLNVECLLRLDAIATIEEMITLILEDPTRAPVKGLAEVARCWIREIDLTGFDSLATRLGHERS